VIRAYQERLVGGVLGQSAKPRIAGQPWRKGSSAPQKEEARAIACRGHADSADPLPTVGAWQATRSPSLRLSVGFLSQRRRYLRNNQLTARARPQDFELIISDNASTDATADLCQNYHSKTRGFGIFAAKEHGTVTNHNFSHEVTRVSSLVGAAMTLWPHLQRALRRRAGQVSRGGVVHS
jgi:hypothetical protein